MLHKLVFIKKYDKEKNDCFSKDISEYRYQLNKRYLCFGNQYCGSISFFEKILNKVISILVLKSLIDCNDKCFFIFSYIGVKFIGEVASSEYMIISKLLSNSLFIDIHFEKSTKLNDVLDFSSSIVAGKKHCPSLLINFISKDDRDPSIYVMVFTF